MKKIGIIVLTVVLCFAFGSCGKGFSKKHFEDDGIYQEYDSLSKEEQEQFLHEAEREGYVMGFDSEGRIILTKDGETLVLGESRK